MRKVIAVIGEPGTGKTTLFRKFIEKYNWVNEEPVKLVYSMYCKEKDLYIIGKYEEGEIFAGTDRLSMAVQPEAVKFINSTKSNILFEGDRLTNTKFLDFILSLEDTEVNIIILNVDQNILRERYEARGSDQSETFLKGRKTKISNIRSNFEYMDYITIFNNKTEDDQKQILNFLESNLN